MKFNKFYYVSSLFNKKTNNKNINKKTTHNAFKKIKSIKINELNQSLYTSE